jgi:hypothetical protein
MASGLGPLCDIHRCPLYGRFRGHSGHQPSELSARPPSLAIGLPVALLVGLSLGGLLLLELALAPLRLFNLPSVVLEDPSRAPSPQTCRSCSRPSSSWSSTARPPGMLSLTVPDKLLVAADEVIE